MNVGCGWIEDMCDGLFTCCAVFGEFHPLVVLSVALLPYCRASVCYRPRSGVFIAPFAPAVKLRTAGFAICCVRSRRYCGLLLRTTLEAPNERAKARPATAEAMTGF